MAKIPQNIDVVHGKAPSCESGTLPWDNPGIKPYETVVPETAGEKAMNDTAQHEINKPQPFKRTGGGY